MHNRFEPDPITESTQAALDHFLDQLCMPLERVLPHHECQDTRQELRAHLMLSAAAHEELGATSNEALMAAFQSFGDSKRMGSKIAQEKTAALRSTRRLDRWVRVLSSLIGGCAGLYLPLFSFLMTIDIQSRDLQPPYLLQLLLVLLGGRAGWLLASGKKVAAGGPLSGLIGSQVGMGASAAFTLLAFHHGWLAVTFPLSGVTLSLHAALGAAVGWSLWKRPKPLPGSVWLGSVVFGLPMLLAGLEGLCRYPDYRNAHILGIYTIATLISCAAGGTTGAIMGFFFRFRRYYGKSGFLSVFRSRQNTGRDLRTG